MGKYRGRPRTDLSSHHDDIVTMFCGGKTDDEIGAVYGVKFKTIERYRVANGLRRSQKGDRSHIDYEAMDSMIRENKLPQHEIASIAGCSQSVVSKRAVFLGVFATHKWVKHIKKQKICGSYTNYRADLYQALGKVYNRSKAVQKEYISVEDFIHGIQWGNGEKYLKHLTTEESW